MDELEVLGRSKATEQKYLPKDTFQKLYLIHQMDNKQHMFGLFSTVDMSV